MSYTLYKTNGTFLTTVADGSLDTTTDLTFVGKNYSGYGVTVNQDLVKLLENFAGKLQPTKSLTGQLWYDSVNSRLKVNTGGYYKPVANIESSNSEPSNAVKADFWYDESVGKLKFFDGTNYIVIGPQITGATANNLVEYASITDDGGNAHNVLLHNVQTVNGTKVTVAITSPAEFIVNSSEPLKSSFFTVKKGMTLSGTGHLTGVGSNNFVMWGDASNSLKINGYQSSDLVLQATPQVSGKLVSTTDLGVEINATTRLRNDGNGGSVLANLNSGNVLSLQVNIGGGLVDVINLWSRDSGGPEILPTQNTTSFPNSTNIGSNVSRFGNIYAKDFTVASGAVTANSLSIGGTALVSSTATVKTLMPVSSSNSDIGSSAVPFTRMYGVEVHATGGFYGPILGSQSAPLTASSTGVAGSVAFDAGYVYICVATNTWKRAALTSW